MTCVVQRLMGSFVLGEREWERDNARVERR